MSLNRVRTRGFIFKSKMGCQATPNHMDSTVTYFSRRWITNELFFLFLTAAAWWWWCWFVSPLDSLWSGHVEGWTEEQQELLEVRRRSGLHNSNESGSLLKDRSCYHVHSGSSAVRELNITSTKQTQLDPWARPLNNIWYYMNHHKVAGLTPPPPPPPAPLNWHCWASVLFCIII